MSTKKSNTKQPCNIDNVVGSNTWGEKFQKVITTTSEAWWDDFGTRWPIYDFELDCGLFRIDVMGMLQIQHISDCESIYMDGVNYKLEDVYE